jgi:2-alkyl-3-oxoalkanoate reductase
MTNVKFRAGLVGAGYISEYHIAALRRLTHVEIVGITDVNSARAKAVADKFNLTVYASMTALREAGANVIHILTPPATHAHLAIEAINLGCDVLVEKPLAEDAGDCDRIAQRASETGRRVCVNHSLLYDPQFRRALGIARSGKLGRIVSVDILRSSVYPPFPGGTLPPQYRSAGYPFRDLGVHALYLFEALLGPIRNVRGSWRSLGGDSNLAYDEWRAQVDCRDGLGQFQLSWNVRPLQSQIIIQGTKGVMRVDLFLLFKAIRSSTPLPKAAERVINALTDSIQPLIEVPRGVWGFLRKKVLPYHGLQELVKDFYRSLVSGSDVPVSVAEATRVVRWTEDVARAAEKEYAAKVEPLTLSEQVSYLVTGAAGGLGSAVTLRLVEQGHRVRVLVRRPSGNSRDGVEVALGDLGDPAAVDRAVRGAKCVLHIGAAMKGGAIEHDCATIVGTQNVLDACRKHGVEKLVHVSSMSVVDWAGGSLHQQIDETSPLEPRPSERGNYTRAKLEAERLVSAAVKQHGLPAVILRPGQIFGGRIPVLTGAIARRVGRRWLVLGGGDVRLPLVYIDDVVDAILLAACSDMRHGEIIQLIDEATFTQNEVLAMVVGPDAPVIRMPRFMVFGIGRFSELAFKLLKRQSPFARYRLRSALARRSFKSANAQSLLGWTPRVGVREGIARVGTVHTPAPTTSNSTISRRAAPQPAC